MLLACKGGTLQRLEMRIHYGHAIPRSGGSPAAENYNLNGRRPFPHARLISLFSSKHLIFMRHSNSTSLLFERGPRSRDTTRRCHFAKLFLLPPPFPRRCIRERVMKEEEEEEEESFPMEKLEESGFIPLFFFSSLINHSKINIGDLYNFYNFVIFQRIFYSCQRFKLFERIVSMFEKYLIGMQVLIIKFRKLLLNVYGKSLYSSL